MIKIICVGKLKKQYFKDACTDYIKRISKYHKINVIELKEEKTIDIEADKILSQIKNDYLIVLDINGKENFDSVSLAKKMDEIFIINNNITFVIGSSLGVSDKVKQKADLLLSFSKFTFPHNLFRLILLEQIYRAFKINNNETYHK